MAMNNPYQQMQQPQQGLTPEEQMMLQQEMEDQPGVMDNLLVKIDEILADPTLNKDVMANVVSTLTNAYSVLFNTEMEKARFELEVHRLNVDSQLKMTETEIKAQPKTVNVT